MLPGFVAAWAVLGWRAEVDRSERLAAEQGEVLRRLAAAEDRGEDGERTRRDLEKKLLASELAREQGKKALVELGGRVGSPPALPPVAKEEAARERELSDLRARQDRLLRINQAMRRTGADWLRFLEIGDVVQRELHDVRLLTTNDAGIVDGAFAAGRCRIELDRAASRVRITLFDVVRIEGKNRSPRQTDHLVEFEPIDPRAFEVEMQPSLIVTGDWPAPPPRPPVTVGELETLTLMRERLGTLLARSAGSERMEVFALGRVAERAFHDVEILGYTAKGRLERRLRAARLEVWVDGDTAAVELRLYDGFLEDATSKIGFPTDRPYRLALAGITAPDAERALTGYVQTYRSLPGQR
jgi:hypothetical protein